MFTMGISRGFRRLAVAATIVGFIVWALLWLTASSEFHPTLSQLVNGAFVFLVLPGALVLLAGWVVAGFGRS